MSAGEPNNTHDFTTSLYGSSCTVICVLMGSTLVFPFQDIEHHVGHGGASPPGVIRPSSLCCECPHTLFLKPEATFLVHRNVS